MPPQEKVKEVEEAPLVSDDEAVVPDAVEATEPVQSAEPVVKEIDADLAATLGKPKMAATATAGLGSLLGGRSMFAEEVARGTQAEEEALEADLSGLKGEYDEAKVMGAWQALVEDMRSKNRMGLAATLSTGGLTFKDPVLKLTVANQIQYDELKECATEVLHFVRTRVGNGGIAFEVEVDEEAPSVAFLTPKDRYKGWESANPALEKLRKRLDLDLG